MNIFQVIFVLLLKVQIILIIICGILCLFIPASEKFLKFLGVIGGFFIFDMIYMLVVGTVQLIFNYWNGGI